MGIQFKCQNNFNFQYTKKVTKEKITFSLFHEIVCMAEVIQFIIEYLRKTKTWLKSNYTYHHNLIYLNIL